MLATATKLDLLGEMDGSERFIVLFCIFLIFPTCHSKAVDPAADDEGAYTDNIPKRQDHPPALLTLRSQAMFNSLGSLGSLLNGTGSESRKLLQDVGPKSRSVSEDYPSYPISGGGNYQGGFLGGGQGGSYGSGWGNKAQRVVYIAIPLNALSALLSSTQLNTLGIGSIFPSLPPLGQSGAYGGGSSYGSGGLYGSSGGSSYVGGGGGSYAGGGGSSYSGGSGSSYGSSSSYLSGGAGYVSGLSSGTNYGPSSYGAISYDTGPGLGEVLYGALGGGGKYGGGSSYSSLGGGYTDLDSYSESSGSYGSGGVGSYNAGGSSDYGTAGGIGYSGGGSGYSGGGSGGYGSGGQSSYGASILLGGTVGTLPCPRGPGYYRHPIDCNRFYRCVDYLPSPVASRFKIYEYNCPAGTVYSVAVWVCVWPYQPEAGNCYAADVAGVVPGLPVPLPPVVPFPPPPLGFGGPSSYGGGGSSYGYNDDDKTIPQAKSAGVDLSLKYRNSMTLSTTPKPSAGSTMFQAATDRPRCLSVGYFSHPLDCTQFAQCWKTSGGEIMGYYFKCPPKTVFNAKVPVCDDPVNVPDTSSTCHDRPS